VNRKRVQRVHRDAISTCGVVGASVSPRESAYTWAAASGNAADACTIGMIDTLGTTPPGVYGLASRGFITATASTSQPTAGHNC